MKAVYMIYCALIAIAVFSAPVSAMAVHDGYMKEAICGDLNGDSAVDMGDVILLLNHVGDPEKYPLVCEDVTRLRVNAPMVATDAFNVTIDIENVTDMNGGQFDLSLIHI